MAISRRARPVSQLRLAVLPTVVVGAVFVAWWFGYFDLEHRRRLAAVVADFHALPWAAPVFVVAWAVVVSLSLPSTIACVLGGAVFGTAAGSALNWVGALVATLLGHTIARTTIRASLTRLFGEHRLLRLLRERADTLMLVRLRLMPIAPFAFLDYVAGIAGVRLRRLVVATAVGVIPSAVAYSYVGATIMESASRSGSARQHALWIAGGVTVAMLLASAIPALVAWRRE